MVDKKNGAKKVLPVVALRSNGSSFRKHSLEKNTRIEYEKRSEQKNSIRVSLSYNDVEQFQLL